ncbi:MAG TPA: hypothetical protein VFG46_28285 [Chryseolinea sp.]|nr:hypothetical protein [Chryseolinea sp.]
MTVNFNIFKKIVNAQHQDDLRSKLYKIMVTFSKIELAAYLNADGLF